MTYKIQIDDEVRDATPEETASIKALNAENKAQEKKQVERAALKTATLAKLGLTADEAASLLS